MIRKPIFSFDDTTSTGIDVVPVDSVILIENNTGIDSPLLIYLFDKTGITSSTTIATLLTLTTQWTLFSAGDLDDLDNVTITSKQDGDLVMWDASSSKWINQTVSYMSTTDFTATLNQDTFNITYDPGGVEVFIDGLKLRSDEYTASNGTSVVLDVPVAADTWVQIKVKNTLAPYTPNFDTSNFTATASQTVFVITNGVFDKAIVSTNGVKDKSDTYSLSDNGVDTTLTFNVGRSLNDWISVDYFA